MSERTTAPDSERGACWGAIASKAACTRVLCRSIVIDGNERAGRRVLQRRPRHCRQLLAWHPPERVKKRDKRCLSK